MSFEPERIDLTTDQILRVRNGSDALVVALHLLDKEDDAIVRKAGAFSDPDTGSDAHVQVGILETRKERARIRYARDFIDRLLRAAALVAPD